MKRMVIVLLLCVVAAASAASVFAEAFSDRFSEIPYYENSWESYVLLGDPDGNYIVQDNRRLSFHLPIQDTTIYMTNPAAAVPDGAAEATFENILSEGSAYGLVCRFNEYGWYEFRVNISGEYAGSYALYKYDTYLKKQGKNPYVLLHPNMDRYYSPDIKTGLNQKNTLKLDCTGDTLRIFINGNEQHPLSVGNIRDSDWDMGTFGFMVMNTSRNFAQLDITKFSFE